jgi:hypothetical protein
VVLTGGGKVARTPQGRERDPSDSPIPAYQKAPHSKCSRALRAKASSLRQKRRTNLALAAAAVGWRPLAS